MAGIQSSNIYKYRDHTFKGDTMMAYNQYKPGRFNNYLIAGNLCNAFAIGEIGDEDDFFLVGVEPEYETNYPLLTGNLFDSKGNLLCRLARNALVLNPGNCTKVFSDRVGFELYDADKRLVFKLQTRFESGLNKSNKDEQMLVATITGNFYDKSGAVIFKANGGEADESVEPDAKAVYGYADGFGLVKNIKNEDMDFVTFVLATRGRVHLFTTGMVDGQEFPIDGRAIVNAEIQNCTIHVKTGEFIIRNSHLNGNKFVFYDQAENMRQFLMLLNGQEQSQKEKMDRPLRMN